MNFRTLLISFLAVAALSIPGAATAEEDGLSLLQQEQVETIIEEYLIENPEILIRAMDAFRAKQERNDNERMTRILTRLDKDLRHNPASPLTGNPDGDVTVVEFFDYRCPYCKQVLPTIKKLLEADKNVRFVFKEFPILGPESVIAAQAAVAVWKFAPDKYMDFHSAIMGGRGKITEAKVFSLAEDAGLDPDKLRQWIRDPAVNEELAKNAGIADKLKITGTPAFIVGNQIIRGAADLETMRLLVSKAREGKGK